MCAFLFFRSFELIVCKGLGVVCLSKCVFARISVSDACAEQSKECYSGTNRRGRPLVMRNTKAWMGIVSFYISFVDCSSLLTSPLAVFLFLTPIFSYLLALGSRDRKIGVEGRRERREREADSAIPFLPTCFPFPYVIPFIALIINIIFSCHYYYHYHQ